MTVVYEDFLDLIVNEIAPDVLVDFQPSEQAKGRLRDLVQRRKTEQGLTQAEESELATFLQLEHILRLAKAKARTRIGHE